MAPQFRGESLPSGPLLLQLLDHADTALLVVDGTDECSFVNGATSRLTDLPAEALLGSRWRVAFDPADGPAVRAALARTRVSGQDHQLRVRLANGAGGASRWVELRLQATRSDASGAVLIAVTGADASAEYERLAVLLKVLPCGVAVEDARGRLMLINEELRRMFSLTEEPAAWIGRDGDELNRVISVSMRDPAEYLAGNAELVAGRRAVTDELTASDGRIFERDYLPVLDHGGYNGHVWMYWDFTERKAAEQGREKRLLAEITAQQLGAHAQRTRAREAELAQRALAEENEALAAIDALRAQLLATSSHELRTPLTAMISFIGLLAEITEPGDERAEYIEVIERNAQRLLSLVTDLLLLTRIGSGAEILAPVELNLIDVVQQSLADSRMKVASRSVTVEAELPECVMVRADPLKMAQVVDNLLSNSVKYSRVNGVVTVRVAEDPTGVRLTFIDRGIGIPAAEQGQLFGQFFRASTARESGKPGTGLGLAIVKAIVEQHGGAIELTSREGVGTTVTVTLPALDQSSSDALSSDEA